LLGGDTGKQDNVETRVGIGYACNIDAKTEMNDDFKNHYAPKIDPSLKGFGCGFTRDADGI